MTTYVRLCLSDDECEVLDELLDEFVTHALWRGLRFDVAATLKYGEARITFEGRVEKP